MAIKKTIKTNDKNAYFFVYCDTISDRQGNEYFQGVSEYIFYDNSIKETSEKVRISELDAIRDAEQIVKEKGALV